MYSITNYNSNIKDENKYKENFFNKIEYISKIQYNKEYSVKTNNFNPTKSSLPNEWESRLLKRVNSFNNLELK